MTYIFNGEMTLDAVEKFMDEAGGTEEGVCTVYFSCVGGSMEAAEIMIDFINMSPESYELVATWELHSAGFWVFNKVKCSKRILSDVWSVVHLTNRNYSSRELLNPKSVDYFLRKNHRETLNKELEYFKDILSKPEYNRIKRGEDLYLNSDRIKAIFNV